MTAIKKSSSLSKKFAKKQALLSICNQVIERELVRGRLKQPKSIRNLRRWLKRQVIKREDISTLSNRSRLTKVATMLLMASGLLLSGIQSAQAAPTFTRIAGNPHNQVIPISAIPFTVDIDADGDLDLFTGRGDGTISYWANTGSAANPSFGVGTNPLNSIDVGNNSAPTFADIDNDGDFDAFVMELYGTIKYFENTGTIAAPVLIERTGVSNPLDGVDVGISAAAAFMDVDSDGDLDAILGRSASGGPHYYENTGSAAIPNFIQRTGYLNPFADIICCSATAPTFGDMDADGDKDLFLGWSSGYIYYFENNPAVIPGGDFTEMHEADNPLFGFDVGSESAPTFVDIDNDGDLDAFSGVSWGSFSYFENTGSVDTPLFVERTGGLNPLDGKNVGGYGYSKPVFADIDNDGDFDLFAGEYYGVLVYFENTGSAASPSFVKRTGGANPLDGVISGYNSAPVFADIDADGDLDFFTGQTLGAVSYYENTGSAASPVFVARTGVDNPLNGFDVGGYSTPSFADVDGDGDLDLFAGEYSGTIKYAENTGSAASPTFVERIGALNPLDGFDVHAGWYGKSTPTFADIDNDGDLDAFVGELTGTINFFRNDPGAEVNSAPTFDNAPTISGTPQVGEILSLINTATTDVDGDNVTLSYQWQADSADISGATSAIYTLTANESAQLITCIITADDGNSGITIVITAGVDMINSDSSGGGGGGGALNPWSLLLLPVLTLLRRKKITEDF